MVKTVEEIDGLVEASLCQSKFTWVQRRRRSGSFDVYHIREHASIVRIIVGFGRTQLE